jgi:hypothetical protein
MSGDAVRLIRAAGGSRGGDAMVDVFTTALIGAVFGLISGLTAAILERRREIAKELIEIRRTAYAELWKSTGALPRWSRERGFTYPSLEALSADFRTWYFETGGMYLSRDARERYGAMQEAIATVLDARRGPSPGWPLSEEPLSVSDYDLVLARCSALRTERTDDLLSRRGAGLVDWRPSWLGRGGSAVRP